MSQPLSISVLHVDVMKYMLWNFIIIPQGTFKSITKDMYFSSELMSVPKCNATMINIHKVCRMWRSISHILYTNVKKIRSGTIGEILKIDPRFLCPQTYYETYAFQVSHVAHLNAYYIIIKTREYNKPSIFATLRWYPHNNNIFICTVNNEVARDHGGIISILKTHFPTSSVQFPLLKTQ